MKVSFIGAGRAGGSLGVCFARRGAGILGYFSRSGAKEAAEAVGGRAFDSLGQAAESADIIVISVPDGEIGPVAEEISKGTGSLSGKTFLHLSGAHSSLLLLPLWEKGANIASLHPPFTFATPKDDPGDITFTLEGRGLEDLKKFLDSLNLNYIEISTVNKALYHAAAVMASNYVTALLSVAFELLEQSGLKGEEAQRLFENLTLAAVKNTYSRGLGEAMTGPVARGDFETVRAHLDALINNEEIFELYKILGRRAAELVNAPLSIREELK